jgi:selenophosphate synthetase-related protein
MPGAASSASSAFAAAGDTATATSPDGEMPLSHLARLVANHAALRAKSAIGLVSEIFGPSDWLTGPGDDGAAVPLARTNVVACGEALWPSFVKKDPFGAGIAAVLANVNDLAAMGAIPLGIVDTIVSDSATARRILEGIRFACEMYDVPLLGGHLTHYDGEPALSAFGVGRADHPLSSANARAGHRLIVVAATDGDMRDDFPFFRAFDRRKERMADDVRLFADVATTGACVAAKDISMAGLVGSLAMLLEHGRLGVELELDALPRPKNVPLERWLTCFPSFGFLLCAPAGKETQCMTPFLDRDLDAAVVGTVDSSGVVALARATERASVIDLTTESVTGLRPLS